MRFIDEITTVRFSGRYRRQGITVVAEVLEDPVRARLFIDGTQRERQDLPARFDLGDSAAIEVVANGRTVTDCAIVADGQRTSLTLSPDSVARRYLRFADRHPLASIVRVILGWVVVPVLFLAGLARLVNLPFLERPLSSVGISTPVDLPWVASWWFIPLAVALLFLLGAEEDIRTAYRRFLTVTSEPIAPSATVSASVATAAVAPAAPPREPDVWDQRFDRWGKQVDRVTRARFTGRHAGQELSVIFDFFDEPTHARLLVDGEDRGNKGVPARFDLSDGATLEADATQWAVTECAVVAHGVRTRLTPLDDQTERAHHRFFDAHPLLETVVRTVGGIVIVAAILLGAIDLYNLVLQWEIVRGLPLIDQLPDSIDLPIGLTWWQALLVSVLPAVFEFDRDVRRSNKVFRPETEPAGQGDHVSGQPGK